MFYFDPLHILISIVGVGLSLWAQAAEQGSARWNEVRDTLLSRNFAIIPTFSIYVASRDWMRARAQQGDVRALLEYRSRAPHGARTHPTDEHLLPLYVALGAASGADGAAPAVSWHEGGVELGALVMDAVSFGPEGG